MKLARLELRNFKGLEHFVFSPEGKDCSIHGTNGLGKTTITDGVAWLLTDKSANGKALNPKTLDGNGAEIHNLEHSAEGNFIIEDGDITLKKIFKEKWVKKRGSTSKEFTGHETKHFVDDVPVSKSAYNKKAEIVANIETFKLLSDIDYLPGKMPWKKRRELILEICGDISDEEVIKDNSSLSGLTELLGRHTVDDFTVMTKASMSKINEDIKSIPVRVDEANRSKVETSGNVQDAIKMVEATNNLVAKATGEIADLESSEALTKKNSELVQLKLDLQRLELDADKEVNETKKRIDAKIAEHQAIVNEFEPQLLKLSSSMQKTADKIVSLEKDKSSLYLEFDTVNDLTFDQDSLTCPTCDKPSTPEEAKVIVERFNSGKSAKLAKINATGKEINAELENLGNTWDKDIDDQKIILVKLTPLAEAVKSLTGEKDSVSVSVPFLEEIANKTADIDNVKEEIIRLNDGSSDAIATAKKTLEQYKQELSEVQKKVIHFETNVNAENRIDELTREEKSLAQKYEEQEGNLYLCEEFTRSKVEAMEGNISEKFNGVTFKMFTNLINGGLQEICEVLVDGVPYDGGLNNGARIGAGINIVNTLTEYYGVTVPTFIDNAEGCVKYPDSDSQMIKLYVSESDKSLRVEVD